jgi:hypothetical protein
LAVDLDEDVAALADDVAINDVAGHDMEVW